MVYIDKTKYWDKNASGMWWFIPNDEEAYKRHEAVNGFGSIKYDEGSVYVGDVYFDGKFYHKLGHGQQDFSQSVIGKTCKKGSNQYISLFVGEFDHRETNWIYGNGVLYFRDKNGNPNYFCKGFFDCLNKVGEWKGEFDYNSLLAGYSKEMEISDYERGLEDKTELFLKQKEVVLAMNELKTLYLGDSYIEFWSYPQYSGDAQFELIAKKDEGHIGLGGAKFIDFLDYDELFEGIKEPQNIVVNLGFNDIHFGYSPLKVYEDFLKFKDMIRRHFPNAKLHILDITPAPGLGFVKVYDKEEEYLKLMYQNEKTNDVKMISTRDEFVEKKKHLELFVNDLCHINNLGYRIVKNAVDKVIK